MAEMSLAEQVKAQRKKAEEEKAKRAKMSAEDLKEANKAAVQGMKTDLPSTMEEETAFDAQGKPYQRKVLKKAPQAKPSPSAKKASGK